MHKSKIKYPESCLGECYMERVKVLKVNKLNYKINEWTLNKYGLNGYCTCLLDKENLR